jgi:hypothetical protein
MAEMKDNLKFDLGEDHLEKVAGGKTPEIYKKYASKYPVTAEEVKKVRMAAKKIRKSEVSYGEYRAYMWGVVKPEIDSNRQMKYADSFLGPNDPEFELSHDLEGMYFNILIDNFWVEFGGIIDPSQN